MKLRLGPCKLRWWLEQGRCNPLWEWASSQEAARNGPSQRAIADNFPVRFHWPQRRRRRRCRFFPPAALTHFSSDLRLARFNLRLCFPSFYIRLHLHWPVPLPSFLFSFFFSYSSAYFGFIPLFYVLRVAFDAFLYHSVLLGLSSLFITIIIIIVMELETYSRLQ